MLKFFMLYYDLIFHEKGKNFCVATQDDKKSLFVLKNDIKNYFLC